MTGESGDREVRSWKTAAALIFIVAAGAVSCWLWARSGDEGASAPAVCTQCNAAQTVKVGDAPGLEEWPRQCSKCGAKHLYMARKCERCGKSIPFKDPNAEKFGIPEECPSCKRSAIGS